VFSRLEHPGLSGLGAANCLAPKKFIRPFVLSGHHGRRISGTAAQSDARLIVTDSSLGLAGVSAIIASPGGQPFAHEHRHA